MKDYKKYINALRKCAKEHENDITFTGHIIVSDLCRDTANLLEKVEQEPCDDVVSRQAILDGIEELKKSPWATDKRGNGFEYLITEALDVVAELCVKQLPSVTPSCDKCAMNGSGSKYCDNCGQKSVKWIEHPEIETSTPEYLMFYECSECGDKSCFCKSDIHKKRFCSNCGARMVEPQESEEV